jgi:hypothetical protein
MRRPQPSRRQRSSWVRMATAAFLTVGVAYLGATAIRVYVRKYYLFLPSYVRWTFTPGIRAASGPTHIFFLFTDHFEPDYNRDKTRAWADRYMKLAERHRDSDGRPPQHTWFYPGEQTDEPILNTLRSLMQAGLGEVEMHLHHEYDTVDTLRPKLRDAIDDFQRFGFLKTVDGRTEWAFIHGNFGLDNSNGDWVCGVNDEIKLLREMGCFADFTFPSVYMDSQPPSVNSIYAAKDDPQPKSYRRTFPLTALEDGSADLMIFEGPLIFAPTLNLRRLFLDLDDGDIHPAMPATRTRVDRWVKASVQVQGRPDWVFIKVFAHGVSSPGDEESVVGPTFDDALTYLEHEYNDGQHYVLHYVTAREAYNLAMAAADGEKGDPSEYYDRTIPPYVASARRPSNLTVQRASRSN